MHRGHIGVVCKWGGLDVSTQHIGACLMLCIVSLGDFHGRRIHPGEPLSVFLRVLKRLLDQAMPEGGCDVIKMAA